MKATLCVEADDKAGRALVEAWFERWRPRLVFCSENEGCGCCVDLWNVDAPAEAVAEIPEHLLAMSDWTSS